LGDTRSGPDRVIRLSQTAHESPAASPRHREHPDPVSPMPGESGPGRHSRLRGVLTIAVGVGLLVWLLFHAGLDALHDQFDKARWLTPLVLLPYVVISICDAISWRLTLPFALRRRVPFATLVMSRMAGEAVNSVTPTATIGGEPLKAHLLRAYGVPLSDGLASIVVCKTALTIAQSLFTALGFVGLLIVLGRPMLGALWLVALLGVVGGFTFLLLHVQQRNPATALWRWASRVFPRVQFVKRLEPGVRDLDERLQDFYRGEQRAFAWATGWNFVGWLFGVVEVQVMCTLIDHPLPWLEAFVIEAVAQPIRAVAIVVPGGIGIQEWGGVEFCTYLGMPEPVAATLWLLKRGREIVFDIVGLAYLARRGVGRQPQ
jgi:glycosyltransferase 2 family protein